MINNDKNSYRLSLYKYRNSIDKYFECTNIKMNVKGLNERSLLFVLNHQLYNEELWELFIKRFKTKDDGKTQFWTGEFFGKMARGASFIYKITRDKKLYEILKKSIKSMLSLEDENGRITTYSIEDEFCGWDLWIRKYVMLAFEYFLEISEDDELNDLIINSLKRQADYIISKIGKDKIDILDTSNHWGALNSSTILEPMMKLFFLTEEKRYFDFSSYIVESGGCKYGNLISEALSSDKYPYNFSTNKAYEMMSFFDGVLEYYSVTKIEKYKDAFLKFIEKVISTDYTIIGCSGCTHELFDNSSIRQIVDQKEVMQETCVTVTLLKLLNRALELTGDYRYADLIEKSYYNAMLGSINFKENDELYWDGDESYKHDYVSTRDFIKHIHGLTFDSYSPLYKKGRNRRVGGYNIMYDDKAYGCCACIGSLGVSIVPLFAIMENEKEIIINHYMEMDATLLRNNNNINIKMSTLYPFDKKIKIQIHLKNKEQLQIKLRIPEYTNFAIINGKKVNEKGYYSVYLNSQNEIIDVLFDFDLTVHELESKIALTYGPIVYAIDNLVDDINKSASNKIVSYNYIDKEIDCNSEIEVFFSNGEKIKFVDYGSSGKEYAYSKNLVSVWVDQN